MIAAINKKSIKEFIKFSFVGGLMTGINLILFYAFIRFLNFNYVISNVISYIIAVVLSYFVNIKFTFVYTQQNTKQRCMKFIKYCIMRLIILGLDSILLFCFVDILTIDVYVSKITLTIMLFICTFGLSKYILTKK